jgi:hypothetical protein
MIKIRWFALPLVVLPLYSIVSSIEACSSGNNGSTGTSQSSLVCAADETAKKLAMGDVCCRTLADGRSTCRKPGEDEAGAPCTQVGATKPGSAIAATFDVCVQESCSGDRECTEFPLVVEETTGTLRCVQNGLALTWELEGGGDVHRVERACLVSRTQVCYGAGYSSSNPDVYGYSPAYFSGYGETCGYGSGYGAPSISVRRLFLLGSTCTAAGGAPAPCPVSEL